MKLDMFELGMEDVHFAAVLEDDFVIELIKGFNCRFGMTELNKSFPDFGLLEDEYFDNLAEGSEELVEVIVGDDVSVSVVDTNK